MKLYNFDLSHGLILAPLSGYTNWPLRMLCRRFGCELAYTEMLSATGLVRREPNTIKLLERPEQDRPLVAQIFGHIPDEAAEAARILEQEGFDAININMGCPVRKVVVRGCGAALMREENLAREITEKTCAAVRIPVSVKMRAGWDVHSLNAAALAQSLSRAGAALITVHPRTRGDMYQGIPRWEIFSEVRRQISIPLVASGDIRTMEDMHRLRKLGADGFMIGRGAIGRPWIFRELQGGQPAGPAERRDVILEHLDQLQTYLGDLKGVRCMRKFLSAYVKGLKGAANFRQHANIMDNPAGLRGYIIEFFERLINDNEEIISS